MCTVYTKNVLFLNPPPPWKFQFNFIHCTYCIFLKPFRFETFLSVISKDIPWTKVEIQVHAFS